MKRATKNQFRPGVSGNPNGRPKMPPEIREAWRLTQQEFVAAACKLLDMTPAEIEGLATNPNSRAIELLLGSIISRGVREGDPKFIAFLTDRLLGRPAGAEDHPGRGATLEELVGSSNSSAKPKIGE